MLERGRSIADCQIVKPLAENRGYQTCLVESPEFGFAWIHLFNSGLFPDEKARHEYIAAAEPLLGQSLPDICTLLRAAANDDHVYALYPVPVGQPLAEKLGAGFNVRQALEVVRQVAECLSLAHSSGLWHGNISPGTIFLGGGTPVLADFALSSLVRLDFNSGVDPNYSSPELVRGEALGPASDLYSLGIVIFHLLAGKLPFTGDEPFAIAMQHLQGEIPLLPEPLAVCQSVIHSLLQPLADERITAEELKQNLDRLLALPELDELQSPIQLTLEEVEEPESSEKVASSENSSRLEQLMVESDVAARIEKRLKERAAALQLSAQGSGNERADSARMAAINRQDGQVSKVMNRRRYQQKSGWSRFLLLTLMGIAIGAVLYLLIYEPSQKGQSPAGAGVPVELAAALEAGRLQLQADDSAAAEQTFVALIEEFPGYPQPYNNLAVVYASQGNLDRARMSLEQALATDESYTMVYRNLGTVYAEMARDSYGRALQLKKGRQAVSLQMFAADGPLPLPLDKLSSEPVASTAADSEVAAVTAPEQQGEVVQPVEEAAQTESSEPATPQAAAVPPALQKEVATVVLKPEPEAAELFLQRWAAAWSAQDVETYLAFYADSFVPSNGRSRQQWEKSRQLRLTRPKTIEISLENFSMVRMRDDKMQLEVTQSYRSDRYADRTRKLFDLQHKGDRWAILRERSLGRVR